MMPTPAQMDTCPRVAEDAGNRLHGVLEIGHVLPDHCADRAKAFPGDRARQDFDISPDGTVLCCHAAETIGTPILESVPNNHSIGLIWHNADAMNAFRGSGWMQDPCRSRAPKAKAFGGCRSQAHGLPGNAHAADPACGLSAHHAETFRIADTGDSGQSDRFICRTYSRGTAQKHVH